MKNKKGFTLVELSIVLVIVGLLIGGILAGQSLIKSAKINSVAQEYQRTFALLSTFNTKYGCVPGDCIRGEDFFEVQAANGNGDGDGYIESSTESAIAWWQLAYVGFLANETYPGLGGNQAIANRESKIIPEAKYVFRSQPGLATGTFPEQKQGFRFSGLNTATGSTTYSVFTADEALALDFKLDNGVANSGNLRFGASDESWAIGTWRCVAQTTYKPELDYNTKECIVEYFVDSY